MIQAQHPGSDSIGLPFERSETSLSPYALVIPAHNEAATIREIAQKSRCYINEVIVVDDGSTDETRRALEDLPITVLRNPCNMGKASSLWRGFQHALGRGVQAIVTLDGDGQHSPEDIPRLIAQWEQTPNYLIIGVRKRNQRQVFNLRVFANRIADFWISWAAGYYIADSQSGFRVYPSRLLQRTTCRHGKPQSFVFESEILIEAAQLGYRSIPLPIESETRKAWSASHFRPALDVTRITRMVAWKLLSRGMYPTGLYRSLKERFVKGGGDGTVLPHFTSSNRNSHPTR
jgi:glycosyltransferase involved in cell wall biosynthesis